MQTLQFIFGLSLCDSVVSVPPDLRFHAGTIRMNAKVCTIVPIEHLVRQKWLVRIGRMTDQLRRWPRTEIELCGRTTRATRRSDVVVVKKILLTYRRSTLHVGSAVVRGTSIGLRCREQYEKQSCQKDRGSEKSAIHRFSPIRLANRSRSGGEPIVRAIARVASKRKFGSSGLHR